MPWSIPTSAALLLLLSVAAGAQTRPSNTASSRDTSKIINVEFSQLFERIQTDTGVVQKLVGRVELRQDSVYMYCDSALIFPGNRLVARGNVLIQQSDSVSVFSDSLIYQGNKRVADLYSDVALVNGRQKLFTERLNYNLDTKIATYQTGGLLTNDTTQLTSKRGYYYVRREEIFFRDSVVVVSPDFTLRSDTLAYQTKQKRVRFLGPTLISQNDTRIYCEDGYYLVDAREAVFRRNAQYVRGNERAVADAIRYDGNRREVTLAGNADFREAPPGGPPLRAAVADTIRYNELSEVTTLIGNATYLDAERDIAANEIIYDKKRERYRTRGRSFVRNPPQFIEADDIDYDEQRDLATATGSVVYRDTSANYTVVCARAEYRPETEYLKASGGTLGRPLLINVLDGDSLFLSADTLLAQRADTSATDSSRLLVAFPRVRIFKSNLQVVCDSLAYNEQDSSFRFFRQPLVWSDTSQFSADTVILQLADEQIQDLYLNQNALIINSPDEQFFNQIRGRTIRAIFLDNNVDRMRVNGNARAVYYALDDDGGYVGVNRTSCSRMLVNFGNNEVQHIRFFSEPEGEVLPMRGTDHNGLKLEGFRWEIQRRPDGRRSVLRVP